MNTSTATLTKLRDRSMALWDLAVNTCITPEGVAVDAQRLRAEQDRDAAQEAWERAIDAYEMSGWTDEVTEALEEARSLAAEWGDDSPEREALDRLRGR